MKFLHFLLLCCFSAVCVGASEEEEEVVRGHVGGDVSIRCSGDWTTNGSSEHDRVYFCRGACSNRSVLVQAERRRFSLTRRGRYSVEIGGSDEAFSVTLQGLRGGDAGPYHCGVGVGSEVSHQRQISLVVLDAPTVPPGSPPSSTATLQTPADAVPRPGPSSSAAAVAAAASPAAPSEEKRRQQGGTKLTGTTVVIIVSGSLAFLVCAIIPLIFYGHWRSTSDDQNRPEGSKGEVENGEQSADAGSAPAAMRLQAIEPKVESEVGVTQDSSHYAAIYQALDPKALD